MPDPRDTPYGMDARQRCRYGTHEVLGGRDDDAARRTGLRPYPTGRDARETQGALGLHGHWVKLMLHYLFIYKAKALPGWQLIPE